MKRKASSASAIGAVMVAMAAGVGGCGDRKPREFNELDALFICQKAVKLASKNQDTAEAPYAPAMIGQGQWRFEWGIGNPLKLQNGYGAMLTVPGSCAVSMSTKQLAGLVINGERVYP